MQTDIYRKNSQKRIQLKFFFKNTTFKRYQSPSLLKYNFIYFFIYGCAGSLLLGGIFSSCSRKGLLSHSGAQASHCLPSLIVEHGLWGVRAR